MKSMIKSLAKHLKALHCDEKAKKQKRAPAKLTNDIFQMHLICYGNVDKIPNIQNAAKLVEKLLDTKDDLFLKLAQNTKYLEFDARKQTSDILNYVIRRCNKNQSHCYIQSKTDRNGYNPIINALFDQYNENMSSTVHELAKRPEFTKMLLTEIKVPYKRYTKYPFPILNLVRDKDEKNRGYKYKARNGNGHDFVQQLCILAQNKCFNVSTDAYQTLYHLLIHGNKEYVSRYLNDNFETIFNEINKLIRWDHFVTQKQFLLLLRDVLTKTRNYDILIKYTAKKANLAIIMNLMKKYKQNSISFEAYHIFKIFVANPKKQKDVNIILWKNKRRLIDLLSTFHDAKAADNEKFATDRSIVIECIRKISLPNGLQIKKDKIKN